MTSEEEFAWAWVAARKGIGRKTLWEIARYLDAKKRSMCWLLAHREEFEKFRWGNVLDDYARDVADRQVHGAECEYTVIHPLHPDFPLQVKRFHERVAMPALLFAKGNTDLFRRPGIAIVGSRNADEHALGIARRTARELAEKGVNIISGHAKGVDSAAHCGALEERGTTTIVASEGLRRFRLREELREFASEENVLIISQFEPNAKWQSYFAMERNKLIVALAGAVLVVQSGPKRDAGGKMSGTFNAAKTALDGSVPVFVVSPRFSTRDVEGNRAIIARGGIEWDPQEGVDVLLSKIRADETRGEEMRKSPAKKKGGKKKEQNPAQSSLFENRDAKE